MRGATVLYKCHLKTLCNFSKNKSSVSGFKSCGRGLRGLITVYKNSRQNFMQFSKIQGSVLGFESCSRELRIYPRRSLTTGHAFVKYISSDVRKHEPQQQGTPRHPPHRAEREYPLQVPVCPRHGDDSRNDNGTPAQPQLHTMGAALSERQLG